jgi:hypothetical protein
MQVKIPNDVARAEQSSTFDFMAVTPLDEPPQPPPAWLLQNPGVSGLECFFGQTM